MTDTILSHLTYLYGEEAGRQAYDRLGQIMAEYRSLLPPPTPQTLDQRSSVLITYGDMVHEPGSSPKDPPLVALNALLHRHLVGVIDTVHLLPFYPYSSDDGFSVIDYRAVDPALGSWEDITAIGRDFRLMFDAVVNHISAQSDWFQAFLRDEAPYDTYFVTVPEGVDVSQVFRPRARPLLTRFATARGVERVWTTFSEDQIDLNFANPEVLLDVMDLLLFYVQKGAAIIRLDAIAFIWKEPDSPCVHLPQTHRIIQLFRSVLDEVAPYVALITETNVPHQENISYFSNGHDEAQMVYNFTLPPLVLYTFHTGQADKLTTWAQSLELPSSEVAFFNFLASHDGIGVTPVRGILSDDEIDRMAARVRAFGGRVSNRQQPDGLQAAYELNINYLDALGDPSAPDEPNELVARRFLAAQAVMLALRGVPGIYFHSLFGSRGWPAGVELTGRPRTINRQKLAVDKLEAELSNPHSLRSLVFNGYRTMLRARAQQAAFHPAAEQSVLELSPSVFALLRIPADGGSSVLCLQNVSVHPCTLDIPAHLLPGPELEDLLSDRRYLAEESLTVTLDPYDVQWLTRTEAI